MTDYSVVKDYMKKLSDLEPYDVQKVADNGEIITWRRVTSEEIEALRVNFGTIQQDLEAIPAQITYWSRLWGQMHRVCTTAERNLAHRRHKIYLDVCQKATLEEQKKPTEKHIEATQKLDKQVQALAFELDKSQEIWQSVTAMLEGFKAKKDVLNRLSFK